MMRRLAPALTMATLVAFAACGDSGTDLPPVDRVQVTPEEAAVGALGEVVQFQAQALDLSATPLDGLDYEWVSSNPAVATVDQNGLATAVSVGDAFIRATAQGVTGEASLAVRECGTPVSLAAGEWMTVDIPGASECGVVLPSGNAGDRYRIAIVRTGSGANAADVQTVSLQLSTLGVASAEAWSSDAPSDAPDRQAAAGPLVRAPTGALTIAERTARAHLDLRDRERRMLDVLDPRTLLPTRHAVAPLRAAQATSPDRIMIDPTTPTFCTPAGTQTPAFKVAENDGMVIYQDSAQAEGDLAITASQAQQMLDYYSTHGEPIIDDYFDGVSDIDGNDKVLVVVHPVVDGNTAAFVWSGDFFPKMLDGESYCPASNEAELVFFNASLIQAIDEGTFQALETLVHEVKHVSSLYKSIARADRTGESGYHPGWLEEGSAEIAGNMSSRRAWSTVGGPGPHQTVAEQDVRDHAFDGEDLRPEFYGILLRLFRTQGYLDSQPNSVVVDPQGSSADHTIYGSGWVFLRWLGDAYGNAAASAYEDAAFFREQNDSLSPVGVSGLEALTGRTFAQLMVEYAAATMLHAEAVTPPQRAFTTYDFVSAIEMWCFAADNPPCDSGNAGPAGTYPWPVTTSPDGTMGRPYQDATFSGRVGPAGLRIHEFRSAGTGVDAEVLVSAPAGSRVVLARVR